MKIFKLVINEEARRFERPIINIDDPLFSPHIKGSRKKYYKEPIKIVPYDSIYSEDKVKICNITGGIQYLFDSYALDKLSYLFDDNIEILDCDCDLKDYKYVYTSDFVKNALNHEKSKVFWLNQKENRASYIFTAVFNKDKLINKHYFTIEEVYTNIYVSEEFKKTCEENNITGPRFDLVWDSENE